MDHNEREQALRLHESLEYIGLRAQATMVGLSQLCTELVAANVLSDDAVERIKLAIVQDITVSRPRVRNHEEFEAALKNRIDTIFPRPAGGKRSARVGPSTDMERALQTSPEELRGEA
ncbi:hypothetical protein P1X14_01150 [Sphingomonas sp. AOB5]|uniref:hypothetical protein n=1 Tax=Sphingomonas sp. AOB5 TaxID=3034017 RepID=UPI0023F9BE93|nr:hypothetical protein [Sphingomonas sp. AOB5]MDF7773840.1 hypothetical protein [Sphingomonas sp. AOB5]